MGGRAVGWTGTFFILSQRGAEGAGGGCVFLNSSPKTAEAFIDLIDVEFFRFPQDIDMLMEFAEVISASDNNHHHLRYRIVLLNLVSNLYMAVLCPDMWWDVLFQY